MLSRRPTPPVITAQEAAERARRGELQLIDVRESDELAESRVPGADHIPVGNLAERIGELERRRPLAFLCASGARSAVATRAAANAGLDAANVEGGIRAWAREGLPLVRRGPGGAA